jgi:hypothetical protein
MNIITSIHEIRLSYSTISLLLIAGLCFFVSVLHSQYFPFITGDEANYVKFAIDANNNDLTLIERISKAKTASLNYLWPVLLSYVYSDNEFFWLIFVFFRILFLTWALYSLTCATTGVKNPVVILPYLLAASIYSSLYIRDDLLIAITAWIITKILKKEVGPLIMVLLATLTLLRFYYGVILSAAFIFFVLRAMSLKPLLITILVIFGAVTTGFSEVAVQAGMYFYERVLNTPIDIQVFMLNFIKSFVTPVKLHLIEYEVAKYESIPFNAILVPFKIISVIGVWYIIKDSKVRLVFLLSLLMCIPAMIGDIVGPRQIFILQFSTYLCFLAMIRGIKVTGKTNGMLNATS